MRMRRHTLGTQAVAFLCAPRQDGREERNEVKNPRFPSSRGADVSWDNRCSVLRVSNTRVDFSTASDVDGQPVLPHSDDAASEEMELKTLVTSIVALDIAFIGVMDSTG